MNIEQTLSDIIALILTGAWATAIFVNIMAGNILMLLVGFFFFPSAWFRELASGSELGDDAPYRHHRW
jgi:hypothetical protein